MTPRFPERRKMLSLLLISAFILPLIFVLSPNASAQWTQPDIFTNISPPTVVDAFVNHSIAISPNDSSIQIVLLDQGVAAKNILYQSSASQDLSKYSSPDDYQQLSNTTGNDAQEDLGTPVITVDRNGTAQVAYDGKRSSDHTWHIYYANNSQGVFYNYTVISATLTNPYPPSIVCTNDSVIHIFFYDGANLVQYYSSNNGTSFSSNVIAAGYDNPDGVAVSNVTVTQDKECIYLVARNTGTSQLVLFNATTATGWASWTAAHTLAGAIGTVTTFPKIDAVKEFVAVAYQAAGGVYEFNSTGMHSDSAAPLLINAAGRNPGVAVDRDDGVSVIYVRNIVMIGSFMNTGVFVRNSRDGKEDNLATDATTPLGEAALKEFPAVAKFNDTVVVVYQRKDIISGSANNDNWSTYITGFGNFYTDSNSSFSNLRVAEDNGGIFLFEGLTLSYNSTVNYNVSITITDTATGSNWTNVTTLLAGGGYEVPVNFYNFNQMFLSDGNYSITLSNASSNMAGNLVKFFVDLTRHTNYATGDPHQYYITEVTGANGTQSAYKMGFEWRWWNATVNQPGTTIPEHGRFTMVSGNTEVGAFSPTNHADLLQFNLNHNILYNITLTAHSTTDVAEIRFYNNSVRLPDRNNALFIANTSQGNTVTCAFAPPVDGDYYAIICRQNVSSTFTYSIFYDTCPRGIILENPMNGKFLNTFTVPLQWAPSSWDTGHIQYYEIQVDTNSSFNNFSGLMLDYNQTGETSTSYTYTATTSAWFYWRVRAVDYSGNLGAWSGTYSFAVDITPPNAPVLAPLPLYFVNGRFQLNWTVPSDGPFTVQSYNIYMSTLPGVTASSANMITVLGTQLQNFYFTPNLSPGYYYFRVSAVDHAGWESVLSNEVNTVVVLGKYFDSRNQNFSVQAGDVLEYEIENVISPTMTATGQPNFTYGYGTWATSFITGNRFHFWIQNVDRQLVTPVTANFYGRLAVSLGYDLLTTDYPLIPFVASSDPAYMRAVAEAFVTSALFGADLNGVLNYTGTAQYGFNVVNTYTLTYSSVYIDAKNDHYAMRASFVYDATTGVLLELTSYNALSGVGYSLRLVDTTVPLSVSWQTWNPVIFIVALLVFAGIISVIIKKVQYR